MSTFYLRANVSLALGNTGRLAIGRVGCFLSAKSAFKCRVILLLDFHEDFITLFALDRA